MSYRLFIDSAMPTDWRGVWLHGVTTNPLIIQRAGRRVDLATAAELVAAAKERELDDIQLQVIGDTIPGMIINGYALHRLWDRVTVKVPATADGFEAAHALCEGGINVTITACYTAQQAMLAAAIGAKYVAPYYGRMLEAGLDADARLDAMLRVDGLRVLVASIRTSEQLETLVRRGFDAFTLTPAIAKNLGVAPESDAAAADFLAAAEKSLRD